MTKIPEPDVSGRHIDGLRDHASPQRQPVDELPVVNGWNKILEQLTNFYKKI